MSGIVGIVNLDGAPVDRDLLARMTDFVAFRGPDTQQFRTHTSAGLGHTMLRTTLEAETEIQPLSFDGEVWLTADARIDARQELVSKLETKLQRSITSERIPNDAELILYAFEAWNEECVKHLIGDFAFAIWDGRARRLFCARDHFGVKPFFYARTSHKFLFSNTLNALRLDEEVSDDLNEVAIGDYLLFGVNQDLSTTTFRDIFRLPGAHSLTVSDGSVTVRRYWTPTTEKQISFSDSESFVEQFTELLSDAIEDRLRTNRVAVSMSGGLDSTAIAAITRDLLQPDSILHAYTVVYKKLIPDQEHYYSRAAAEHIGIPITHVNADKYSLFDEQFAGDLDQPEPFLLSPLTGQFNDLLRLCAHCSRVALTGWDGDAFMNEPPNAHFTSAAKNLKLKDLAAGMSWYVWTQRGLPPVGFRTRLKRVFGKQVESFYPAWIEESFAQRINLRERWKHSSQRDTDYSETRPSATHALSSAVWASLFEGYDAGATRLHLEMRHPLIDLRLVEYLLAIPAVPWCVNKHILRLAMKDQLPGSVLNRPKQGLAGDPALQLARDASVRWLDSIEVNPQLKDFVNLNLRPSIADEQTSDGLWASLRVFALNYWLTNSQSIDRRASETPANKIAL